MLSCVNYSYWCNMDEILYKKILGENIRKIRKRTGLTQDLFSEKIGIEPSSLSNIENGKSFPSALTIIQIQKKFNIVPNEILNTDSINFEDINIINKQIQDKIKAMDEKKKRTLWKIMKVLEF